MQIINLSVVILFILIVATILIYKIFKFTEKINKLYEYFITSEKDKNKNPISVVAQNPEIPPINGGYIPLRSFQKDLQCPTIEQLKN